MPLLTSNRVSIPSPRLSCHRSDLFKQGRTLRFRRSYLGLDHCRFHFAEAQFSRRVEPICPAQPFGPAGRPKMSDQRLQLTYSFVKDELLGISS
jgi:hypothetical protein